MRAVILAAAVVAAHASPPVFSFGRPMFELPEEDDFDLMPPRAFGGGFPPLRVLSSASLHPPPFAFTMGAPAGAGAPLAPWRVRQQEELAESAQFERDLQGMLALMNSAMASMRQMKAPQAPPSIGSWVRVRVLPPPRPDPEARTLSNSPKKEQQVAGTVAATTAAAAAATSAGGASHVKLYALLGTAGVACISLVVVAVVRRRRRMKAYADELQLQHTLDDNAVEDGTAQTHYQPLLV